MEKDYFVHESSYVDDNVKIGKGTRIWHFSHVSSVILAKMYLLVME